MQQGLAAENLCVDVMGGVESIGLEKAVGHAFGLTGTLSVQSLLRKGSITGKSLLIERARSLVNT